MIATLNPDIERIEVYCFGYLVRKIFRAGDKVLLHGHCEPFPWGECRANIFYKNGDWASIPQG
jgi:hypothetical protein